MKKNLFLGMFAAASMLLATSCSNDELDGVQPGNEATVSFPLGVEGGVQTRAISDGTGAKELHYRVFDENGNPISDALGKKVETVTSYPHEVKLTLAKGQTYTLVFWAQNSSCTAYTVDDEMNVTIDYTDAANNDEARDAFFKAHTFTVTDDNLKQTIELTRPFAQLNVGVPQEDVKTAEDAGFEVLQSAVTVKNVPNKIDLKTGAVTGAAEITYTAANIPDELLNVKDDSDGNATDGDGGNDSEIEQYNWLSMSYILANDPSDNGREKALLERVSFTFSGAEGSAPIVFDKGLINIPVRRNYRTNIIVKGLLLGDATFSVNLDAEYENYYNGLPFDEMEMIDLGITTDTGKKLYFAPNNLGVEEAHEFGNFYTYGEAVEAVDSLKEAGKLDEKWRFPTEEELSQLSDLIRDAPSKDGDVNAYIADYQGTGVAGIEITSESTGQKTFFPFTGRLMWDSSYNRWSEQDKDSQTMYWSSTGPGNSDGLSQHWIRISKLNNENTTGSNGLIKFKMSVRLVCEE